MNYLGFVLNPNSEFETNHQIGCGRTFCLTLNGAFFLVLEKLFHFLNNKHQISDYIF